MSSVTFRCTCCGTSIELSEEQFELYSEGYMERETYCCEDCLMESSHIHFDEFSDADPGL